MVHITGLHEGDEEGTGTGGDLHAGDELPQQGLIAAGTDGGRRADDADAAVAVTGEDKDNIIAAMIARKNGVENTFALVNSRSANTQMINVGENILIDRTTITISAILKELRKVRLNNACTLGLSGEVWEIAVDGNSTLIGSTFAQLGLPEESRVCALIRKGETRFLPAADEQVEEGDVLVFFVAPSSIRRAEKIFA